MIIAKYKANSTDCLPTFNGGYIYTSSYVDNGDGTYTFTLESDNNFTSVNFQQKQSLLSVEKLAVTSSCTSLNSLFNSCSNLTSVNTQGWDTSNVTTLWALCNNCSNLSTLDVSNFDTSKVTNMSYIFNGCRSLKLLNLSNWNTSKATSMDSMFSTCSAITSLDVSNFDTSNVKNMSGMFNGCSLLEHIDVSNFDTSNVENMAGMFSYCSKLILLDLSNFNTSKVTNMSNMIRNCALLTELNLSNFDTSMVTTMFAMFYDNYRLVKLDISNFTITDAVNISNMFDNVKLYETGILFEIGMLYCNKTTIDKVTSKLPSSSKSNIYVLDEDISKLNKLDNITFVKALEHEEEITLPYQMARVDGVKDRLYYDESIGKYILEKNIDEDFNVIEKQVIETDIDLMELDTYDTTYITVTSRLDSELKVNEEYCKLDILSSDGGENNINNELFLSEPLRRIGDVSDRLYWDFTKEKYVIERKFGEIILCGNANENWGNNWANDGTAYPLNSHKVYGDIICDKFKVGTNWGNLETSGERIAVSNNRLIVLTISNDKTNGKNNVNGLKKWLSENPTTVIYELSEPVYEELDINRMDLKSYIPTTHLTTPNIPLKTSITVDTNIAKYKPVELLPDTKYTLLVDAMGGENDIINVDLGGATNRFKPTQYAYGKNKVSITTPSTLSTDYLSIYGETNKVKDIMLIQGDVNQHPEYFDGTQSTGELQGDGSYKIDILSQSESVNKIDIEGVVPITLEDTNEGKYISIDEIYGNTWQDTESSKNLCDVEGFTIETWTGTFANHKICDVELVRGKTYCFANYTDFNSMGSHDMRINLLGCKSDGTEIVIAQIQPSYEKSETFTIDSNSEYIGYYVNAYDFSDVAVGKTILLQIEEGTEPTDYTPYYKADLSDIRSVGELQEDGTYKVDIGTYTFEPFVVDDIITIYHSKPLANMKAEKFEPVKHLFNQVHGFATANNLYDYYYIDNEHIWVNVGDFDKTNAIKVLNDHIIKNTKPEIKSSIYLPQPLRAIGEFKDRLYWDDEKGKYCIEQNTDRIIIDGNAQVQMCSDSQLANLTNQNYTACYVMWNSLIGGSFTGNNHTNLLSMHKYQYDPVGGETVVGDGAYVATQYIRIILAKSHFDSETITSNDVKDYLASNPISLYYVLNSLNVVELDIEEKISLNSYNETTYITTNSNVEHEIKGLYDEFKSHNVSILLDSPLTDRDKIYYDNGYKVDRNGDIETPVIKGDEINLPKLYQGINTYINTTTGNIKPSEIKVEYKEFK